MKPAFSLFGVSIESKHSVHVVKHVGEDPCPEAALKVSSAPAVGLFVGLGVFFEVSPVARMSVLAVDVEVLKHVIKVEGERLVGACSLRLPCVHVVAELIILSSSALIGQNFISCTEQSDKSFSQRG